MRSVDQWMIWWLVSMVGAVAGVLMGFIVTVVVYPLFSFVSFFLILLLGLGSIFAGIGLAGAAGGAVAGTVIGFIQDYFLEGKVQDIERWVKIGKTGWALAGMGAAAAFLPIKQGDLSPLIWLIALGAAVPDARRSAQSPGLP